MLTTKQVRAVIRNHLFSSGDIWTNKTTGDMSDIRRVKCYMPNDSKKSIALITDLRALAGVSNVNLTKGSRFYGRSGITVRCVVA